MKNLHLILLSLLSITMFIGCDELEDVFGEDEKPNNPQIEMNTPEDLFATDGGSNTISFNTTENWTAHIINSRADTWCTIYPTSGSAGDAIITVTTTPNDTPNDRTVSIVIEAGTASKTINVSQKQKDVIIISNKYVNVGKDGEKIEVKINTNVDYDVQIPSDATWVVRADSRALVEKSFYLNVSQNNSDLCRNTNIAITNKESGLSEDLVIIQQGNKTDLKIAYSTDKEELEGWTDGLFGGEGTYTLGKPHGDNGYLMTIGNILEEKGAIVFMDKNRQVREIFIDNSVIIIEDNKNGGVDVSVIEKGGKESTEHIILNNYNHKHLSSDDHSQQVG